MYIRRDKHTDDEYLDQREYHSRYSQPHDLPPPMAISQSAKRDSNEKYYIDISNYSMNGERTKVPAIISNEDFQPLIVASGP